MPTSMRTVVVGLLVDPGLPSAIAHDLAGELPHKLTGEVRADVSWEVRVVTRALPLDADGNP